MISRFSEVKRTMVRGSIATHTTTYCSGLHILRFRTIQDHNKSEQITLNGHKMDEHVRLFLLSLVCTDVAVHAKPILAKELNSWSRSKDTINERIRTLELPTSITCTYVHTYVYCIVEYIRETIWWEKLFLFIMGHTSTSTIYVRWRISPNFNNVVSAFLLQRQK